MKFNITPEFIKLLSNVYFFFDKMETDALGGSKQVTKHIKNENSAGSGFSSGTMLNKYNLVAQDTPFLIRNRAGYNVYVTPLGEKRSERYLVENNSQTYIKFLMRDEFSSLTAYNREVEVIVDSPNVQERPLVF